MIAPRMSDRQFLQFQELIYKRFGILYKEEKKDMLQAKISRQMRSLGVESYDDYLEAIRGGDDENWSSFVDDITIHTTNFFRERNHFDYLRKNMDALLRNNPLVRQRFEIRAWSSACSTGEEAYSLAMVLREALDERISLKILATDVSRGSLARAAAGWYRSEIRKDAEPYFLQKYFSREDGGFRVNESLRRCVRFRFFNLAEHFPFRNVFDVIFCRNVMIYFSPEMQQALLGKMARVLPPGGLLFIGHSESLIGKQHRFQYVQPTIYMR
jgi:chemotaxis protein methyltransferase CheR